MRGGYLLRYSFGDVKTPPHGHKRNKNRNVKGRSFLSRPKGFCPPGGTVYGDLVGKNHRGPRTSLGSLKRERYSREGKEIGLTEEKKTLSFQERTRYLYQKKWRTKREARKCLGDDLYTFRQETISPKKRGMIPQGGE